MSRVNAAVLSLIVGAGLLGLNASIYAIEPSAVGIKQEEGLSWWLGLDYQSGDYGTPYTTDLWTIPVGLDYIQGPFSAGVSSSFMSASSNGVIIVSKMGGMGGISGAAETSASGIGDVNMYASYEFPKAKDSQITYHVTGLLKLGTADADKGLGTGENDYGVEGGLLMPYQKVYVFAILGYQVSGDSATTDYNNVWYGNAGATYPMGKGRKLGGMLSYSQAVTPGFDDPLDATVFYKQGLDKQRNLYLYFQMGLSDGSPDYALGASVSFPL